MARNKKGSSSLKIGRLIKDIAHLDGIISRQKKKIEKNEQEIRKLKAELKQLKSSMEYKIEMIAPEEYREELLRLWYLDKKGVSLDLDNVVTLDEKIQWLKLHGDLDNRARLADKYLVRDFIRETIGEKYLIPLIGVYDRPEDIDFDKLPDRYVVKTNHGAGYVRIVEDNSKLDREELIRTLKIWLAEDYSYKYGFEIHYAKIDRKIIIEEYIEDAEGNQDDYKFYCFGKDVDNVVVCVGRNSGGKRFYLFDENWQLLRTNTDGKNAPEGFTLPKPEGYEEMCRLAGVLSEACGEPFVRVDLYNCDGRIYFGELTFTPGAGADKNRSIEEDIRLGNKLILK